VECGGGGVSRLEGEGRDLGYMQDWNGDFWACVLGVRFQKVFLLDLDVVMATDTPSTSCSQSNTFNILYVTIAIRSA